MKAPGRRPARTVLRIAEGERLQWEAEPGGVDAALGEAPGVTGGAPGERPRAGGGGGRTAAFLLGGVGIAGLVAAAVTGALVLEERSTVEGDCDGATRLCRSEAGPDAARRGRTLLVVNAVALGIGAAGLGAGVYLLVTRDDEADPGRAAERGVRAGETAVQARIAGRF